MKKININEIKKVFTYSGSNLFGIYKIYYGKNWKWGRTRSIIISIARIIQDIFHILTLGGLYWQFWRKVNDWLNNIDQRMLDNSGIRKKD